MAKAKSKQTQTPKSAAPKIVRVTVPAGDTITEGFFEAQGPRGVSNAMRMLIHMFVAEYGTQTDVMSVVGQRLVAATSPAVVQHAVQQHTAPVSTVSDDDIESVPESVSPETDDTTDSTIESVTDDDQDEDGVPDADTHSDSDSEPAPISEPSTESTEPTKSTKPDTPSSPSLDMEDIFGKARNS